MHLPYANAGLAMQPDKMVDNKGLLYRQFYQFYGCIFINFLQSTRRFTCGLLMFILVLCFSPVCSISGLAGVTGLSIPSLTDLVCRHIGLVALPVDVVSAGMEKLAAELRVGLEDVLQLVTYQPTLLTTQVHVRC